MSSLLLRPGRVAAAGLLGLLVAAPSLTLRADDDEDRRGRGVAARGPEDGGAQRLGPRDGRIRRDALAPQRSERSRDGDRRRDDPPRQRAERDRRDGHRDDRDRNARHDHRDGRDRNTRHDHRDGRDRNARHDHRDGRDRSARDDHRDHDHRDRHADHRDHRDHDRAEWDRDRRHEWRDDRRDEWREHQEWRRDRYAAFYDSRWHWHGDRWCPPGHRSPPGLRVGWAGARDDWRWARYRRPPVVHGQYYCAPCAHWYGDRHGFERHVFGYHGLPARSFGDAVAQLVWGLVYFGR